jgi:hypothetical protein
MCEHIKFDDAAPEYVFHELAALFPMISEDELNELAEDIKKQGLLERITLFEGKILDGRNRYKAAKQAGVVLKNYHFKQLDGDRAKAEAFVISANIRRRHLTSAQKRDLLAKLIKANPDQSDRQIGDVANVDHKTVGAVREGLQASGEIPQLNATKGKDGKTRKRKGEAKKGKVKPEIEEPPKRDMTKYKAFLETVLDALGTWPKDAVQAGEWYDYTIECLDRTMTEHWPEPDEEEETDEDDEQKDAA